MLRALYKILVLILTFCFVLSQNWGINFFVGDETGIEISRVKNKYSFSFRNSFYNLMKTNEITFTNGNEKTKVIFSSCIINGIWFDRTLINKKLELSIGTGTSLRTYFNYGMVEGNTDITFIILSNRLRLASEIKKNVKIYLEFLWNSFNYKLREYDKTTSYLIKDNNFWKWKYIYSDKYKINKYGQAFAQFGICLLLTNRK